MFPERKEENESKPRRRRAETDDSIRSELLRQQFAEDRRRKLAAAMDKPKREIQVQSPVYDSYAGRNHLGGLFLIWESFLWLFGIYPDLSICEWRHSMRSASTQ